MTEAEIGRFLEGELELLEDLAENSRKQTRKLEKRLWAGLQRLSMERDQLLLRWQKYSDQRKEAEMMREDGWNTLRQTVFLKQREVEQLHGALIKEVECAKRMEALKLQQLRKGQAVINHYQDPLPISMRWNIQG
ncbi:MAG: hypothetical protein VB133_05200 [Anaeromusa sp.]|uniref:hypothetical protein n=1 Tax=Anaeromusa sp. TaxID=1872520 RepID=UPI0026103693|nr:hypothetical protein [Anaeromusa sp.]MDD3158568.1 hypothetical protein [Anaeromusa sp.]MEA4834516.1 hypothetical protein [Anaeromusa sp.]